MERKKDKNRHNRLAHIKNVKSTYLPRYMMSSVTRLGDFLHFGQLFKAFGNN